MHDFIRIPDYPNYLINQLGEVRSERSGIILSHDDRGRVNLLDDGKSSRGKRFYIGELLAMVKAPAPQKAEAPDSKTALAGLEKKLGLARRANAHLLKLVKKQEQEIRVLQERLFGVDPDADAQEEQK